MSADAKLVELVQAQVLTYCSIADVRLTEDLFDLGIQSLDLMSICSALAAQIGVNIEMLDVIGDPSITGIARVLAEKLDG